MFTPTLLGENARASVFHVESNFILQVITKTLRKKDFKGKRIWEIAKSRTTQQSKRKENEDILVLNITYHPSRIHRNIPSFNTR